MQKNTKKVKENTKGQKQMVTENQETLDILKFLAIVASVIYFVAMMVFSSSFSRVDVFWIIFTLVCYIGGYQFLVHKAKPKNSASGHLINSNELVGYVKNLIFLTAVCQVLSLFSNYFWFLWLLAPGQAMWILWKNSLQPFLDEQLFRFFLRIFTQFLKKDVEREFIAKNWD